MHQRVIAILLLSIILSSSLKAGSGWSYFTQNIAGLATCCSAQSSKEGCKDKDEDKSCCNGESCQCTCCLHIVNLPEQLLSPVISGASNYITKEAPPFEWLYFHEAFFDTFHPPLC